MRVRWVLAASHLTDGETEAGALAGSQAQPHDLPVGHPPGDGQDGAVTARVWEPLGPGLTLRAVWAGNCEGYSEEACKPRAEGRGGWGLLWEGHPGFLPKGQLQPVAKTTAHLKARLKETRAPTQRSGGEGTMEGGPSGGRRTATVCTPKAGALLGQGPEAAELGGPGPLSLSAWPGPSSP